MVATRFGCMVASRGGYRMARGWHYAKLSLSNAPRLSFSGMYVYFVILVPFSLSFLFVFFFCFHWSLLVDVPLIFFCPADHVPDWQSRKSLGMVEARSVNVKTTTTTSSEGRGAFRFFFKQQLSGLCRRYLHHDGPLCPCFNP